MAVAGENERSERGRTADTVSQNGPNEEHAEGFVETATFVVTEPHRGNRSRLARELGVDGQPTLRFLVPRCRHCDATKVVTASLELFVRRRTPPRLFRDGAEVTATLAADAEDERRISDEAAPTPAPVAAPEGAVLTHHLREQQELLTQYKAAVADQRRLFELAQLSLSRQEASLTAVTKEVDDARARLKRTLADHDAIVKDDLKTSLELRKEGRQALREQLQDLHANQRNVSSEQKEQLKVAHEFNATMSELSQVLLEQLRRKPAPLEEKLKVVQAFADSLINSPMGDSVAQIAAVHLAQLYAQLGGNVSPQQVMDSFFRAGAVLRRRFQVLRTLAAVHGSSEAAHSVSMAADYLEGNLSEEALDLHLKRSIRVTVTQTA